MIPTARLWAALTLLALPAIAAGFLPGLWPVLLVVDAVLLALAAVDGVQARRVVLEARRVLPAHLSVGVANRVELDLMHRSRRRTRVWLRDEVPADFAAEPADLRLALAPAARAQVPYRLTPGKRGRFEFGDLHVRVLGPLGLLWHERRVPARTTVSVYPDLRGASRLLLSGAALDLVNLGLRKLRQDGQGSEFARLRDYAQGDSVRDVSWKATARRGRPVTRVTESERSQSVLICVDAGRSMAARVDGLTKLDHAVNAALYLAFVAVRNGDRVGLALFADGVKAYLPPDAGRTQYRRLVDALYSATPALTYVDYLALFKELHVRLSRRSLLCLFTDVLDEEQALAMAEPLRRLSHRHVPLCLTVKDTALSGMLREPPTDAEAAYQHAVAAELLTERESLKARVARGGVQLVDVASNELSLAAVNRYLELKARGAL